MTWDSEYQVSQPVSVRSPEGRAHLAWVEFGKARIHAIGLKEDLDRANHLNHELVRRLLQSEQERIALQARLRQLEAAYKAGTVPRLTLGLPEPRT